MINVKLEVKKKGEIEAIQKRFKRNLSKSRILESIKDALNETMTSAISNSSSGIIPLLKDEFSVDESKLKSQKNFKKMAQVKPKARVEWLYAGVELWNTPVDLSVFPYTASKGGGVTVKVKGKSFLFPHAFEAKMPNQSQMHIFGRGRYLDKHRNWRFAKDLPIGRGEGFRYTKNPRGVNRKGIAIEREAITLLKSTSVYLMGLSDKISSEVCGYMSENALKILEKKLQSSIDSVAK